MDRSISDDEIAAYADFDNRYLVQDVERRKLASLPTVDLGAEAAPRALRKACIDIGFTYLAGHGFAPSEADALLEWGRRFFALPREEKTKLLYAEGRGYVPAGGLSASAGKAPDIKERLYLARQFAGAPAPDHLWPDERLLPGFRAFATQFLDKAVALVERIGATLAQSLDLDPHYFAREHGRFGATLAFNYYPPLDPKTIDPTQWSFSPHTDYGSFALVFQDGQGGLQVRNAGGDWIDVTPVEGTLVFNIGDLMALATNDLYTSNLHRVANFNPRERISATLFVGPPPSAEIRCLPNCEGPGNPARYPPVNAEEYTNALVEAYHRTGRPGIGAQTQRRFQRQG